MIKNLNGFSREPREKLPKVKLAKATEGSANRVLDRYLIDVNNIPKIIKKFMQWEKLLHLN